MHFNGLRYDNASPGPFSSEASGEAQFLSTIPANEQ
jgi:hypothetical protein